MEIGGNSYSASVTAAQPRVAPPNRPRQPRAGFDQAEDASGSPFNDAKPAPVKVGFGSDSVKIPNLAANTIKRNVRQAEQLVPTLEESEARVRERVEKDERRVAERETEKPKPLDLHASRESAVNAARSFVATLNSAAGEARFRTGQYDEPRSNRLDIRIGETQVPYDKPEARKPLDLFA